MAITREEFESEEFYRERSTKKQERVLSFLLNNNSLAFTTKEIAKEIYGDESTNSLTKIYYILNRLHKKGYLEKKLPYWTIKPKE